MSEEEQEGLLEHLLLQVLTYAAPGGAELYVGGGAGGTARAPAAPGPNLCCCRS
jgi:hypothetical protein